MKNFSNIVIDEDNSVYEIPPKIPPVFKNIEFVNHKKKHNILFSPNEEPLKSDELIIKRVRFINIELSSLCNYSLFHKNCPIYNNKEKIVLSSKIVYKVIDELAEINYSGIINFNLYNEPLIDPRLFTFLSYIKKNCPNATASINTNGFYLTQTIVDELEEFNVVLYVSAYTKSEYDRLTSLQANFPYMVFYSILDDRKNLYDKNPINLNKICHAPVNEVGLSCTGDILLCCLDWKREYVFGNLYEETLSGILEKSYTKDVYSNLLKANRTLHICKNCSWTR